jgi:hypothetical protein
MMMYRMPVSAGDLSPGLDKWPETDAELQRRLTRFNHRRLAPGLPHGALRGEIAEMAILAREESFFLEAERMAVVPRAAAAPLEADAFVAWFETLKEHGPGQGDPLFPWLAETATHEEMRWFLAQEVAGEAGFDDLVALTQVKMPVRPKLELARNYWDEMGRGNAKGLHGGMLATLANALRLEPALETTMPEALALANTMTGLALNRHYAYHAIGALGAIELTAPGRSAYVAAGLKRLGLPADDRHYFDLHAVLDVKHSAAWNAEIIHPLVNEDAALAPAIAEGALMRLTCGARCFARYRQELGVPARLKREMPAMALIQSSPSSPNRSTAA